jgi:hypothetical protein
MAVKVMVAAAIVNRAIEKDVAVKKREDGGAPKPKRRRSSVYDADGNEVFITLMCLKCHKMRPLSQFGLRKMADGAIRNQPWCRTCRSMSGAEPKRKGSAGKVDSSAVEVPALAPLAGAETAQPEPAQHPRTGSVAAEVAAALAAGLRR